MVITVKVKTNSKENSFEGLKDNVFVIRIKEKPINGKANKALIKFFANKLNLNTALIKILSGETSHYKRLSIETKLSAEELIERLKL